MCEYWWCRYGHFAPGEGILPHMGEVISHYRKKRYRTQAEFAIASGFTVRAVQEWETALVTRDLQRRIFLARMLRIPPALLGLDWRLVAFDTNKGEYQDPLNHFVEIVEEDTYYHYEDTLIMTWGWFYNGRLLDIADRFERRLRKLESKVQYIPEHDKEAWKELLCHYRLLATQIARHRGMDYAHKQQALRLSASALQLVQDIDDNELLALMLDNRADVQFEQEHYSQAKAMSHAALEKAKQLNIQTPLYGTVHLLAANIFAPHTANDDKLATEIRGWLDKTLNIVYSKNIEPDRSFLKLNLAAVHHERAKAFLQFHQLHPGRGYLKDASNEIKLAWQAFTPDIAEWAVFFHLTEARILEIRKDLEESAKLGLDALKAARNMRSRKREPQIQALYYDLMKIDANNPYVHNLGVELGIF